MLRNLWIYILRNESEITAQRDHYLDDYADEKYEEMRDQELF